MRAMLLSSKEAYILFLALAHYMEQTRWEQTEPAHVWGEEKFKEYATHLRQELWVLMGEEGNDKESPTTK